VACGSSSLSDQVCAAVTSTVVSTGKESQAVRNRTRPGASVLLAKCASSIDMARADASSGVACADCHMPYMRQGGLKISDHHVNSPLLKVNRSCQTCHHFPEEELKARVEDIQDTFFNLRNTALDALVDLINDIKAEKTKGATDAQLAQAREYQRKGQFMIDFVMSENSMGFHAPQEATRILGDAINLCRLGQLSLHGGPVPSHNPPTIGSMASTVGRGASK